METRFSTNALSARNCSTWFTRVRCNHVYRKSLPAPFYWYATHGPERTGEIRAVYDFQANPVSRNWRRIVLLRRAKWIKVSSRNASGNSPRCVEQRPLTPFRGHVAQQRFIKRETNGERFSSVASNEPWRGIARSFSHLFLSYSFSFFFFFFFFFFVSE